MKKLLALLLAILPGIAWGQNAIIQNGSVAVGDLGVFAGDRTIESATKHRSNTGRGINPFSVMDSGGAGLCTDYASRAGPYSTLCLSHDSSGNGIISLDSANGLTDKTMYLRKNGTLYEVPFNVGGVVGPNPTQAGNLMLWNNSSGTAARDAGNMLVSILKYGAVSGQDNPTQLQAAITAACAGGFGLYFPDGDWQHSTVLTVPCSRIKLQGQGPNTKVRYTGAGPGDAGMIVTGAGNLWSVEISDMTISANANVSYALQSWKSLHLHLTNLRLRDAAVSGYAGSFGVLNSYKNISVSSNDETFATIPQSCLKFFDHGDGLGGIYAAHIDNMICEGVGGDGVSIATSNDNIFTGGTSEGNGARGVILASDTNRNTFNGIDTEVNVTEDVKDSGQFNQWNNITSCCFGRFRIGAAANGTLVNGGTFDAITVETNAGTTYPLIVRPGYIANSYAFGGGTSVWDFNGPYTVFASGLACGTGALTTSAAIGRWRVNGKTAHVMLGGSITTNGTCAGNLQWTLPFAPISLGSPPVNMSCNGVNTTDATGMIGTAFGTTTLNTYKYDSTYPGGSGKFFVMNCNYERQ